MKHAEILFLSVVALGCGSSGSSSGSLAQDGGTDGATSNGSEAGADGGGSNVGAGSFPCGTASCGSAQYCLRTIGGPCMRVDGGGCEASQSYACVALPSGCSQCTCVPKSSEDACQEQNGHVYVTVAAP